jgi:hypothetical protein
MIFIILLNYKSNSQDFIVTDLQVNDYVVDPFTKDIYFQPISSFILKANIYTQKNDTTSFPSLPVFANKKHIVGYEYENKIYFYDFDQDITYQFLDSTLNLIDLKFSPNDSAVVFNNTYHEINNYHINKLNHYPNLFSYNYVEGDLDWSSDTTLIRSGSDHSIIQYYIKSGKMDTLIEAQSNYQDYYPKPHLAYNDSLNAVAYTRFSSTSTILGLYYLDTHNNIILFEGPYEVDYRSLEWSPNFKKLAFVPIGLIGSQSGLHIFELDKNKTVEIIPFEHVGFGLKDNIQWLNNDTLLYLDRIILGIKADTSANVVSIENNVNIPYQIHMSNYPNPFNPITVINYTIPEKGNVELTVYNSVGQKVNTLVNDIQSKGSYEIEFDGSNLSSGIYFYELRTNKSYLVSKMLLLK